MTDPPRPRPASIPRSTSAFPHRGSVRRASSPELEAIWCAPKGWQWITAINNNYVGVYYVGAAMLFFVLAGVLALLMRTQLALPMNGVLSQETYNQIFTMHGTVMMFLFAVPAVEALGVLLLPQMLGARDLPFPRLSAYAFWAYLIGGLAFFCSLFFGLAPMAAGSCIRPDLDHLFAGHQRRLLAAGHRLHRDLGHRRRHRDHRRRAQDPGAGHDAGQAAGLRLGHAGLRRA
jgi:hypothetical protein